MRLLLLEDDMILNEIIEEFLISKDYEVVSVINADDALIEIFDNSFDMLLLDVNVPCMNGFELLKEIRRHKIYTPAIFITSKNTFDDVKNGFDVGCDDYIKKPFDLQELNLRINNIKRLYDIEEKLLKLDENIFYSKDKNIIYKDELEYQLSKTQTKVFEYLLKNRQKVVSIDEICINNWLYDEIPAHTTIRTYIKNLRKILGSEKIVTIKNIGYRLIIKS